MAGIGATTARESGFNPRLSLRFEGAHHRSIPATTAKARLSGHHHSTNALTISLTALEFSPIG
ncbi:hypothetical protein CRG98_050390 [Punica granatum]|uniref:Uncharacterized protein n=1 Tax=Punica granatum TaxID=22663 RepID=A0A2I0GCD9_PUNGR|nr:hypothetical protein CRG98_050390 [Punica granatum]